MDLASKWKYLGLALGVKCSTLDTICYKNHQKPEDCLRDTLQAWLQQQYDTKKTGQPSWQLLCKAVENRAGGNNSAVAKSIRERHGLQQCVQLQQMLILTQYILVIVVVWSVEEIVQVGDKYY